MISTHDQASSAWSRIEQAIRSNVAHGKWERRKAIPPVRALADMFGTSPLTARKAVESLMSQGILIGRRGVGVFVAERPLLQNVAVVAGVGTSSPQEGLRDAGRFFRLVEDSWETWAEKHMVHTSVYENKADEDLLAKGSTFRRDLDRGHLHGVIALYVPTGRLTHELLRRGIPVVAIGGSSEVPYRIDVDSRSLIFESVRLSVNAGRKRLALFSKTPSPKESRAGQVFHKDLFVAACHEYGVAVDSRLIKTAERKTADTGYELALDLFRQDAKPDGLVIPDDVMARGVVRAITERGVRVPEDVSIVTHFNRGAPPFDFPVLMTRLEIDPSTLIGEAAEMLTSLMRGEPVQECVRMFQPILVKGDSCPCEDS